MPHRSSRVSTCIMALVVSASPAGAQDARDTAVLREVVITAAGVPVEQRQAPATITVLDGDALRARGIATVADALREVPGVALARTGSFGATTSMFVRGGERDYVKVLIDGVPVNEPGGDFDFAHLGLADVERIEVVRGPASVLFGSDAVSGVVHVITRRGTAGVRASGAARSGSYGTFAGELDARGGTGPFDAGVSAAHRETDGILPFNNAYRSTTLSGAAGIVAKRASARLTARRTAGRFQFPTDGSGVPVDSNQYTREARDAVGLEGMLRAGERTTLRALLTHSELDRTSANLPDSPGDTADYYYVTDTRSTRRGADLRASVALARSARLTIGGALERQREISDGTATFGTFPLDPTHFDERRDTRAGYAEILAQPHPRLQAAAGGRIDDNSRFGVFRTGRAAATVWLAAATAFRASVGSAFKEPAFSEVFPTAFSLGDSALRPERTLSWEIGVEHAVGRSLTIGARWFDQRFRDMVQYRFVDRAQDLTTPNYANVAAATARGVEVEAGLVPWAGGRIDASATRLRTEVTDEGFGAFGTFVEGGPLLRRPEWLASLALSHRLTPRLRAGIAAHYTGERRDYDFTAGAQAILAAYGLVDAHADWLLPIRWSGVDLAATLRIENAFDQRYQHVLGFDAPGRTVLAGVRAEVGR
jgi:vitamin B12 transporter